MGAKRFRGAEAAARAYAHHSIFDGDGKRAWRGQSCPVCNGRKGWCLVDPDGRAAVCTKIAEGGSEFGRMGHLHLLAPEEFEPGAEGWKIAADNSTAKGERKRSKRAKPSKNERKRRDAAYRALLDALPDASGHAELRDLGAASWGPDALVLLAPRLLPAKKSSEAAQVVALLEGEHGRETFQGVPGFAVQEGGKLDDDDPNKALPDFFGASFPGAPALAFPSVGPDGLVEGVRVRRIGDGEGSKYWWLSSDQAGEGVGIAGAAGDPPVSIYKPAEAREGGFLVTEGEKKAAAAAAALGIIALSVPGVTQWRGTLAALRRMDPDGSAPVAVAYDMDWRGKPEVERARHELLQALADAGRKVSVGEWPAEHKGLDDALVVAGPGALRWEAAEELAPRWWCGATFNGYLAREDGRGGVRLVREKFNSQGESMGEELLATCVVRRVDVRRHAEGGEPVDAYEVFCDGRSRVFEADPGSSQSAAKWRQTLAANCPGTPWISQSFAAVDGLNAIMQAIAEREPPREIEVHRAGFDKTLEAYRLPGWRIDGEGFHEEPAEVCPKGFGPEGSAGLLPDGQRAREAAEAWAEEWPKLHKSPTDATIALAAGLCGPFAAPVAGAPCNVILALVGGTGSGKTTQARLLGSLHGQDGRLGSHGTVKGYLKLAEASRDSLTVVDDLREGRSIRDFAASAFDGSRRPTSTRDQKLSRSPNLRGGVVITAETLDGAVESTMNRMVVINFPRSKKEQLPTINAAKARLRLLENPSALAAEAARLALAAGPERLRRALKETTEAGETHPLGSARGRELAALVGLCVGLLRDTFAHVLGDVPDWMATPAECMDRVLSSHAREEEQARPARVFLDALRESLGTRADLLEVQVEWNGRGRTSVEGRVPTPDRGQTLVFEIENNGRPLLFVSPRSTLRALGLDLSEGAIRQSLEDEGLLIPDAKSGEARTQIYVAGPNRQVRGWLIRDAAIQGPRGDARADWLQANKLKGVLVWLEERLVHKSQLETRSSCSSQANNPNLAFLSPAFRANSPAKSEEVATGSRPGTALLREEDRLVGLKSDQNPSANRVSLTSQRTSQSSITSQNFRLVGASEGDSPSPDPDNRPPSEWPEPSSMADVEALPARWRDTVEGFLARLVVAKNIDLDEEDPPSALFGQAWRNSLPSLDNLEGVRRDASPG